MAEAKAPLDLIAYADNMLYARQVVALLEARRPKGNHRTRICKDGQGVSVLSDDSDGIHTVSIDIHRVVFIASKPGPCVTDFSASPVGELSGELIKRLYNIHNMTYGRSLAVDVANFLNAALIIANHKLPVAN